MGSAKSSLRKVVADSRTLSEKIKEGLRKRGPKKLSKETRKKLSEAGSLGAFMRWNLYREVEKLEKEN